MNKQFKEWLPSNLGIELPNGTLNDYEVYFLTLPFSMQWGVYLEFFDSVGLQVTIHSYTKTSDRTRQFDINIRELDRLNKAKIYAPFNTRTEAQQEAIKKAFTLLD